MIQKLVCLKLKRCMIYLITKMNEIHISLGGKSYEYY